MDLSVLPNNNHPDKFLQLDVNTLPANPALTQASKKWHNKVYSQREKKRITDTPTTEVSESGPLPFDKSLSKHITPVTLTSKIKRNPLYSNIRIVDGWEEKTPNPSWTIQEYDRHSVHHNLANYLKVRHMFYIKCFAGPALPQSPLPLNRVSKEDPNDLKFWLEDIYTPGYDSLLKKKENEMKKSKLCKITLLVLFTICGLVVVIIVPVLVTRGQD
uniref:Membrane integral NOTCH2 associated receptor 2 n=1 Tax=Latimeria chalumnae TaxID=7897 RepID=H3AIF9_LATCH